MRAAVLPGCVVGAVGFYLWARSLDDFALGDQWIYIVLAGAGCGLILGPASTEALNRISADRYGQATGINQTLRNFGASVGMAVLGTVLISRTKANVESSLGDLGLPQSQADTVADALSQSGGGAAHSSFADATGPAAERGFDAVRHDFAQSTQTVFYIMAGILAATYILAHIWLPKDRVTATAPEGGVAPQPPATPETETTTGGT